MKILTVLLFVCSITQAINVKGQKVNISVKNGVVLDVIEEIEKQCDLRFAYSPQFVDMDKAISIEVSETEVSEVLDQVLKETNSTYVIDGDVVVLRPASMDSVKEQSKTKQSAQQETKEITGIVTDDIDVPLPGVTVHIKGTSSGTITDIDGQYTISDVKAGDVLVFSFVGMTTQRIEVGAKISIDLVMKTDAIGLNEVVAVGYATQKKVNLTGAVNSLKSEQLGKIKTANATELLQGQVAGLLTKQPNGMPGDDNAKLSIRGYGDPLVIVDGVPRSLNNVDPSTIESINVLKDASAAIYGARSGNGVILVTTKRGGKAKGIRVNYDGQITLQQFTNKPTIISDAGVYTELWNEAELNSGLTPSYSAEQIEKYKAHAPGYESYDWFKYAFNDWASKSRHSISVEGGNEKINFYTAFSHTDQQSVITSDDYWYKRNNLLVNIDAEINDDLKLSVNMDYINEHQSQATTNIWRGVYYAQPMATTSFVDQPGLIPVSNLRGTQERLVGEMNKDLEGGSDKIPQTFNTTASLTYNIPHIKGLSAKASFDYTVKNTRYTEVSRKYDLYALDSETGEVKYSSSGPGGVVNNSLKEESTKYERLRPRVQLNYSKQLNEHYVGGLLIGEFEKTTNNMFYAQTENLLSNELLYLNFGDKTYYEMGQKPYEDSRASYAGRFNYNYKHKYLLEATFRYDATSFFPEDKRWGFFPSVSAGWRLTEEKFMKDIDWLSNLKLRASYSQTGYDNNAIRYDYYSGYNLNNVYQRNDYYEVPGYVFGNELVRKIWPTTMANKNMTWETMSNYNIGIDATLWNGKLSIIAETFYRKRSDVLDFPTKAYPTTFGADLSKFNLNTLDDRGVEIEIRHHGNINDFKYNVKGVLTYARTKWVNKDEAEYITDDEKRILQKTGRWKNQSVGYVSGGLFKNQAEIDAYMVNQDQANNSTLKPGDIRYVDLNGDKEITWADQKVIGYNWDNQIPELNFGLNLGGSYENFSIDVLFQGASMFSGYVSDYAQVAFDNGSTPLRLQYENRYHETNNPNGSLPAVYMNVNQNNIKKSDFWLKEITFIRLKNINLNYALPKKWMSKLGLQKGNLYVAGSNLAVWSNLGIYKNEFDPESALNHKAYPAHRTITFGLNVTL